jgi:hypothetical protein
MSTRRVADALRRQSKLRALTEKSIDLAITSACGRHPELAAIKPSLLACFEEYNSEIRLRATGVRPAALERYLFALRRAIELESIGRSEFRPKRDDRRKLTRALSKVERLRSTLSEEERSAISEVGRIKRHQEDEGLQGLIQVVEFMLSYLATESHREYEELVRTRLKRSLARLASGCGTKSGVWRDVVADLMTDVGLDCIDPRTHPGEFDRRMGEDWVSRNLPA